MSTELATIQAVRANVYVTQIALGANAGLGVELATGSETARLTKDGVRSLVQVLAAWLADQEAPFSVTRERLALIRQRLGGAHTEGTLLALLDLVAIVEDLALRAER